jgi:hypothetical protein
MSFKIKNTDSTFFLMSDGYFAVHQQAHSKQCDCGMTPQGAVLQ